MTIEATPGALGSNDQLGVWVPERGVSCIVLGTGKTWRQQCGGYACLQKSARGTVEAVGGDDLGNVLTDHFCGPKWGGWCANAIDEETAVFIESLVPRFAVDRAAFDKSCEAWVHGLLDGKPAILTWENSD